MKIILSILLTLITVSLVAQTTLPLNYDTIKSTRAGRFYKFSSKTDTINVNTNQKAFSFNKPIFVNGVQLGSGGTANVYAKDGVYKSGDTVKLQKSYTFSADSSIVWGIPGASLFLLNTNGESTALFSSNQQNAIGLNPDDVTISSNNTINLDAPYVISNYIGTDSILSITAKIGTGSNNTSFESDGSLKFNGAATVYDDLFFPFSTGKQGTADYPSFNVDSMYHSFSIDTTAPGVCIMYFTIQMPHSWKEGSTIYPHVHYKHETAVGTPTFKMKYKWYPLEGSTEIGYKWYTMSTTTGTTNKTNQMVYGASGISGSGKGISSIIVCAVYLSGQTGTGNVNAYQFDIHYEKDAIGSRTITSK